MEVGVSTVRSARSGSNAVHEERAERKVAAQYMRCGAEEREEEREERGGSIDCEEREERKVAAQYMRRGVRNVEGRRGASTLERTTLGR